MAQSQSGKRGHSDRGKAIALLLPDLVDYVAKQDALRETLRTASNKIRLLVCIPDSRAEPLLHLLAHVDIETQFLLGHEVEKAKTDAFVVKAPPGIARDDLIEFALALSDLVLVSDRHTDNQWAQYASKKLSKTLVAVGAPLHPPLSEAELLDITSGLDVEGRGWLVWGRGVFGRLEQAMLELLALFAWDDEKRRNRLWRSFLPGWCPGSYFGPAQWQKSCPDEAAGSKASPLAKCFETMDRSALYGSYIHRDITWATHFGVAFAVLFALLGFIVGHHLRFAGLEFLSLLVAASVIWARWIRLQDRWTACRLGAEQLRIARMSLPLLVLPPAFATADTADIGGDTVDYELSALAQAKHAVRQQGLPHVDYSSVPAVDAARWVQLIVADQVHYHERNQQTLERAERSLNLVSTTIFFGSMVAVGLPVAIALVLLFPSLHDNAILHRVMSTLEHSDPRFLIVSAAVPAFVAAVHSAGMRLGFVHRAALSRDMQKRLKEIAQSLDALIKSADSSTKAWQDVRTLAYEAAKAMGAENSSWHGLVRRYRDELP